MRINSIGNNNISFKSAYSAQQESGYRNIIDKVLELQGTKYGLRMEEVYLPAFPSKERDDIGIGKANSPEAIEYYSHSKTYNATNAIKFMPIGQLTDKQTYNDEHKASAYDRSVFAIGEDHINIAKLATKEFGNLIPRQVVDDMVSDHKKYRNDETRVDFETSLGYKNQEDYEQTNTILRRAYYEFIHKQNAPMELKILRRDFEKFKTQKEPVNYDEILTRCALFPWLKDWGTGRTDVFVGWNDNDYHRYLELEGRLKQAEKAGNYLDCQNFENQINCNYSKYKTFEDCKKAHQYEIDFYKFKQFLARKTIQQAVDEIHKNGQKAYIDLPIGRSWIEENCWPDALLKNQEGTTAEVGWGKPAANFYDLVNDRSQSSPAHQFLRNEILMALDMFDGIRVDVGWQYMRPKFDFNRGEKITPWHNGTTAITDFIAKVAKEAKGSDFSNQTILYECDADGNDFNLWQMKDIINNHLQGLVILSSENEHADGNGWANWKFLTETVGIKPDKILFIPNNHDGKGILRCADDKNISSKQAGALQRVFNKLGAEDWREFKSDTDSLEHAQKLTRGRFAEVAMAPNQGFEIHDVLGRRSRTDYKTDFGYEAEKSYKDRFERSYIENYHRALQAGVGYNAAEALYYKAAQTGEINKNPKLYETLLKYALYLKKPGFVSKEQADNSKYANLKIDDMSLDEIRRLDFSA